MPAFLADRFQFRDYRLVPMRRLYIGLLPPTGGRAVYVPVTETPHYAFALKILTGRVIPPVGGYQDYEHYTSLNPKACTAGAFGELIESIKTNGYDSTGRPILVFRIWRRPWPPVRWDVADGFHRLAVLAAIGEETVLVGTLRARSSLCRRVAARLTGV